MIDQKKIDREILLNFAEMLEYQVNEYSDPIYNIYGRLNITAFIGEKFCYAPNASKLIIEVLREKAASLEEIVNESR